MYAVHGKMVSVSLMLPEETNQRIKQMAQESGYSKGAYIRQIIRNYLRYLDYRDKPEYEIADWEVGKQFTDSSGWQEAADRNK